MPAHRHVRRGSPGRRPILKPPEGPSLAYPAAPPGEEPAYAYAADLDLAFSMLDDLTSQPDGSVWGLLRLVEGLDRRVTKLEARS